MTCRSYSIYARKSRSWTRALLSRPVTPIVSTLIRWCAPPTSALPTPPTRLPDGLDPGDRHSDRLRLRAHRRGLFVDLPHHRRRQLCAGQLRHGGRVCHLVVLCRGWSDLSSGDRGGDRSGGADRVGAVDNCCAAVVAPTQPALRRALVDDRLRRRCRECDAIAAGHVTADAAAVDSRAGIRFPGQPDRRTVCTHHFSDAALADCLWRSVAVLALGLGDAGVCRKPRHEPAPWHLSGTHWRNLLPNNRRPWWARRRSDHPGAVHILGGGARLWRLRLCRRGARRLRQPGGGCRRRGITGRRECTYWPLRVVQLPDRDCVRDPASPTGGAAAGHCRPSFGRSLTWSRTAPQRVRPIAWPKDYWPGWFW